MSIQEPVRLVGLDGCKGNAWVVAESDADFTQIEFRIEQNVKPLFDAATRGELVAVMDVTIGLSHQDRACDVAARALLGQPRGSSVFRTPCREALTASTYGEANAISAAHCGGVALSQQTFNIRERIQAVDDLITPALQARVKEGHPEVVFAMLNGERALDLPKTSAEGLGKRIALLQDAGVPSFDPAAQRVRLGKKAVSLDDLVDAAAMLLAARHVWQGTAVALPPDPGEPDERGLQMQMWSPLPRPKGLPTAEPDSHFRFSAFPNPLSFIEIDLADMRAGTTIDAAAVLRFLCSPGINPTPEEVAGRYREIDQAAGRLVAAPVEERLLNKLVWPLREAKAAYLIGSYLGTVALCGIVAEMVAILTFNLAKMRFNSREMSAADQDAVFGRSFEKLGQERRVRILFASDLIDEKQRTAFETIRLARNRYLHRWSADHNDLAETARSAFDAALQLVVRVIGQDFREGAIVLNPRLVQYLRKVGGLRPRDEPESSPEVS